VRVDEALTTELIELRAIEDCACTSLQKSAAASKGKILKFISILVLGYSINRLKNLVNGWQKNTPYKIRGIT
jgi:hypothetical protein